MSDAHFLKFAAIISLIADRRKCYAQGMMGRLEVNTALFDWLLFTLSSPIILSLLSRLSF